MKKKSNYRVCECENPVPENGVCLVCDYEVMDPLGKEENVLLWGLIESYKEDLQRAKRRSYYWFGVSVALFGYALFLAVR